MILSNIEILSCIKEGLFVIDPLMDTDPRKPPFNTSSVDLRLGPEITVPDVGDQPITFDLRTGSIAKFWPRNSTTKIITDDEPFTLKPNHFVMGKTIETVNFPINTTGTNYSARVEGRSSLARCGLLVHFTAPTIHSNYNGTITLELINLGPLHYLLYHNLRICQLIIEEVKGNPAETPKQF